MNKAEMTALWNQVKANHKALDACPGPHAFVGNEADVQSVMPNGEKMYRTFVCTKCGGKVFSHDKHWYERGLKHGREEKK